MSDLVERLRVGICYQQCRVKDAASGCECAEAADEIEFLREGKKLVIWKYREAAARIEQLENALREIADCKTFTAREYMIGIASAALGEK